MALAGFGDRVEGLHAVAAAFGAGRVTKLSVEESRLRRADLIQLVEAARASGVDVRIVSDVRKIALTEAPQGVVAECRPRSFATLEAVAEAVSPAAVMVLDHITDPQNLGAIARSVLAAGFGGLVVSSKRAAPISAVAFKAAAGALEQLEVAEVNSIADAVQRLQKMGLWAVGLDGGGDQELWGLPLLTEPVAMVVGEEGRGISRLVFDRLDARVRIPLASSVESLNASVAAALAAFEVARVGGKANPRLFSSHSNENKPRVRRKWSWRRESNPRAPAYKAGALPTELRQRWFDFTVVHLPLRCRPNP